MVTPTRIVRWKRVSNIMSQKCVGFICSPTSWVSSVGHPALESNAMQKMSMCPANHDLFPSCRALPPLPRFTPPSGAMVGLLFSYTYRPVEELMMEDSDDAPMCHGC